MEFRRVRSEDKERVFEICKSVWDGHDYIPNIFEKWAADEEGEFTMAVVDGEIVGMGKFTMVRPEIGWLEGLRVAAEARSKGFAKNITNHYIAKGRAMGLNALQLSTYYENYASIHVTESYGFKKVALFWLGEKRLDESGEDAASTDMQVNGEETSGVRDLSPCTAGQNTVDQVSGSDDANVSSPHCCSPTSGSSAQDSANCNPKVDKCRQKLTEMQILPATLASPDYNKVVEMMLNASEYKAQRGFLGYGWLFKEMSKDLLRAEVEQGHVYYCKDGGEVTAAMLIYPDYVKDNMYYIVLLTGSENGMAQLLTWADEDALARELPAVGAMVPEDEHLKEVFWQNGYKHWEDMREVNVFIYELPLKGLNAE